MTALDPAQFPWTEKDLKRRVGRALDQFWRAQSGHSGSQGENRRSGVIAGRHLDPFCEVLSELASHVGFKSDEVRVQTRVSLAGYFRPTKKWDVVIIRNDRLCAAIEFKSISSSYGNNLNNRVEESLGSAVDLSEAHRKKLLGLAKPFVGYVVILGITQDATEDPQRPVHMAVQPFQRLDPVFENASYVKRASILCRRVITEGLYTYATLLVSREDKPKAYLEPDPELTFRKFAAKLYGHLIGCV